MEGLSHKHCIMIGITAHREWGGPEKWLRAKRWKMEEDACLPVEDGE